MSSPQRLTLRRRPGPLIARGFIVGIGWSILSFGFYTGAADRPIAERVAVSLTPLALMALTFLGLGFLGISMDIEVDERGLRMYRRGRLRRNLPWQEVVWVAFGHWSVPIGLFTFIRKEALCLLVRGRKIRKSIGMDDVSYQLSTAEVQEFGTLVAQMANARSISVMPKPQL